VTDPQIRLSQLISTFGPGAMLDLPDASVIVSGLDTWRYDQSRVAGATVTEPRLVAKLRSMLGMPALTLRLPPAKLDDPRAQSQGINAYRFPNWFIVQEFEVRANGRRMRRLVNFDALQSMRYVSSTKKKVPVVPVRFVRACTKGHVDEIDWKYFIHSSESNCGVELWVEERGATSDLANVIIHCGCGKSRAMSEAANMGQAALGKCSGKRPWLGRYAHEKCENASKLLIRSASNAYFPQLLSVISIPDLQLPVDAIVERLWANFLSDVETKSDLPRVRRKPDVAAAVGKLSDEELMEAIERRKAGPSSAGEERSVKAVEFEALSRAPEGGNADVPDSDFFARTIPDSFVKVGEWMECLQRVVLVHRLREVVAQVGFTRFDAAGTDIQGELTLDVEPARLSLEQSWLPAVENRGEGIFLQFKPEAIGQWLEREAVKQRGRVLEEGFNAWLKDHPGSKRTFPGLPYYMLHSFAHLLMTAIALECGYPATSLRERIYAMPDGDQYGVLIFTGSSDSEGTLGGLVMAGQHIARHVANALKMGELCSNDPVCAQQSPHGHSHQHLAGAACHGCLLVAETSCEQFNGFLDRSLVVPTVDALGAEFFDAVTA
jgi:Domain of unknown function (DUF1998)